jgi:DNA-binding transcriptional MerR regulator
VNDGLFRVDELAEAATVSVDTVRYYQHRGLLDPPKRVGRLAFYSTAHLTRLKRIQELKGQGLSLETIRRILAGANPIDAALATAVAGEGEKKLSMEEVADEAGVPLGLVESLVAEGLLLPLSPDTERQYTEADVGAVRGGMAMLEAGVPLSRLLELGRRYAKAVDEIAEEAVTLFDEYVRRPTRGRPEQPVDLLLEAFNRLLPAASALARHSFERAVVTAARRRIEENLDS